MSSETFWICILGCEDVFPSVVSFDIVQVYDMIESHKTYSYSIL